MQITLEQTEIEEAVVAYVRSLGMSFTEEPKINFTAGRGSTGITAGIDLTLTDAIAAMGPAEVTVLAKKPLTDLAPAKEPVKKAATKAKPKAAPAPEPQEAAPEVATAKSGSESLFGASEEEDLVEEEPLVEEEDNSEVTADTLFAS